MSSPESAPVERPEQFAELNPPYSTIVADPPWQYQKDPGAKHDGDLGTSRAVERIYSTMTNEEIAALPVAQLAAPASHLYLWVTNPGMFGGRFSDVTPKDIAEAWGFEFKTILTWVKPGGNGMGWFFRGQTEHVLFATRGGKDAAIPSGKREPNVIDSRRSGHSQKPPAFYDMVERVSPGPYLDLFSRDPRMGWDAWGHGYEGVESLV